MIFPLSWMNLRVFFFFSLYLVHRNWSVQWVFYIKFFMLSLNSRSFLKKDLFFIFLLSIWSVISLWNIFLNSSQNLFQCLLSIHGFRIKFPIEGFLRKSRFKSGVSSTRQPWDISFYFVLENSNYQGSEGAYQKDTGVTLIIWASETKISGMK